ncbi:MAG: putative zinc-binding protein [Methanomicrobiales archaeon]|nr:putative zinc-binding protein [Methanomicrobiales archaeon]
MSQQNSCGNCGSEGKTAIIYSCSGLGSNVGQLSNAAACRLTNEGFGNGSCLAGVGGSVEKLIGIGYVIITDLGIEKVPGPNFNERDLETVICAVKHQDL